MRTLIASGTGRYADPWHPFRSTSALVSALLQEAGAEVEIDQDVDRAMTRLAGVDLLVVNAGDPWRSGLAAPPPDQASIDGLADALGRGIGVLALHPAVASLRDYPEWAPAVGAIWVPGLSFHPPAGLASISGGTLAGAPVADFVVEDERYCRLQRVGRSTDVAHHDGPAGPEPTAWVREHGRSRIAVDLLGHDERSFGSAGHRDLLVRLARWAAADGRPAAGTCAGEPGAPRAR